MRIRANKPPSQEHLLDAARHQSQTYSDTGKDREARGGEGGENENGGENEENEEDDAEDEAAEEGEGCRRRATRNSKSGGIISAKTAGYYPASWRAAIDRAKEHFRHYTFLKNLFPFRELDLVDAEEILSKIIADMKARKKIFDPSKFLISEFFMLLMLLIGYSQTRDMNIVVSYLLDFEANLYVYIFFRCLKRLQLIGSS